MSGFVTVPRHSAEGKKYLLGDDRENRFIPIRSENPGHDQEKVTFQIIPKGQIVTPAARVFFAELLKWRKLIFVLFPFVRWLVLVPSEQVDIGLFLCTLFSSLFLFLGVSWQTDILDHLRGYDSDDSGSRVLAKGWMSAIYLSRAAWLMVALSFLSGLSVLLVRPPLWIMAALLAALLLVLFFFKGRAYRQRGIFDFGLVLITGPLFTVSVQYALFAKITFAEVLFGFIWGLLFLFNHSLQSFPKMSKLAHYGIQPWLFLKDFDKNKNFFAAFWFGILLLYFIYETISLRVVIAAGNILILAFFTYRWMKVLRRLKSPVSSDMGRVVEQGHLLVLMFIFLWFMELVFSETLKFLLGFL